MTIENQPPASCPDCYRPQPWVESEATSADSQASPTSKQLPAASQPRTQWITLCRCDLPYSPNAQFAIDVCSACNKRVVANALNKVSHPDLCSCANPSPKNIPAFQKQKDAKEPVELDLASIGMSAETLPLERYTPIAILGQGAKATVLLCRDKQLGKKVAVKCFKNMSKEITAKFEQEAKIVGRMSHPNVVKPIDSGIYNGRTPYVVTDYKEGFNLDQYLSVHGTPSHDIAVKVLISICEALAYGHKESVPHKNIKPTNVIFLDDMNSEPTVVVTDFSFPNLSMWEEFKEPGDCHYMSGDVARNLPFDERAEVYSVGAVGYALLAGHAPFHKIADAREIKNKHALVLPTRISKVNFDAARPGDLEEVVERCLEKDPRERFESITKLMERLEVFPRREKMRVATLEAQKNKQNTVKIAAAVLTLLIVIAVAFLVFANR